MLYALRYEKARPDKVAELRRFAGERFDMRNTLSLVSDLTTLAGAGARSMDLFNTGAGAGGGGVGGGLLSSMRSAVAQVARSVEGVKNVFSQHQPLLINVLDKLARGDTKGDVSRTTLPYCGTEAPPGKFSVVIVFVVGGITFEEALKVADINAGRLQIGKGGSGGCERARS
jgi:vacuolar protein sorting-associated protein 45